MDGTGKYYVNHVSRHLWKVATITSNLKQNDWEQKYYFNLW